MDGSPAVLEEGLNPIHVRPCRLLEQPEAERLSAWRIRAVVHGIRAGDLYPLEPGLRRGSCMCFDETGIRDCFGAFEAASQRKIGQDLHRISVALVRTCDARER